MSRNGRSPSDARRKALNDELSVPLVSNFFPLDRYYEAAEKVYQSFQTGLEQTKVGGGVQLDPAVDAALDDAYVYGKRYCTFCLEALPAHNYYGTPKYRPQHHRHTKQIEKVISAMERDVLTKMDEYERLKLQLYRAQQAREAARKKQLAEQRRIQAERQEQARFAELQRRVAAQKQAARSSSSTSSLPADTEASAMSKLQMLSEHQSLPRIQRDPSGEEPDDEIGVPSTKYRLPSDIEDDDEDDEMLNGSLPPPLLPPPSKSENGTTVPPSYDQAVSDRHARYQVLWDPDAAAKNKGASSNFINGVRIQPPTSSDQSPKLPGYTPPPPLPVRTQKIPLCELQKHYEQDYLKYQRQGKIRVFPLDTYQGRLSESTNGCTVISALVASQHLRTGGDVTDAQICSVIDRQCGPLLRQIRSKLGLGGHALIIPSDVHDHLVDHKLLQQDKFIGAAGGNILDEEHLGEFLKLLSVGENGKHGLCAAAATLFFREHVVSLVKRVSHTTQTATYDLVDSMPGLSYNGQSRASRTHCRDFGSLQVLLRWYASRKFSPAHCAYVDRNKWNDSMADLDPRVFQGFVWGESPRQ